MLASLQGDAAFVVGAVQRPASAWDRSGADGRSKRAMRAASSNTAAEAAVDREAKFHLHSTLQVIPQLECPLRGGGHPPRDLN